MMLEIFLAADSDRNGTIDRDELADILDSVPGLTVTPQMVDSVFDRLDTAGSGSLDFFDFAPLAWELLDREQLEDDDDGEHGYENEQDDDNAAAAAPAAPESAEEMQEMMLEVFNAVDTDRSGTIEQAELADILESVPGLSVTPEVVQRIFDRLDTTGSGKLDFYEFAPLAFELLNREEEEDDDDNDNDDEYDSGADGDDVAVCVRDCDCDHCYCAVVCRTANVVARVGSKRASPRVYKLVGWLVALGRH